MSKLSKMTVEKRTVYHQYGRGKYAVYDARCGEACDCRVTARKKPDAIAELIREHDYVNNTPRLDAYGCSLYANGFQSWCFDFRVGTPTKAGMIFQATDINEALQKCACYADHPDCKPFLDSQGVAT